MPWLANLWLKLQELAFMGVEGLEPTRPFKVNGFSFSRSFRYCLLALRIGLSLYPRLDVRVAPVESLHLPISCKLSVVNLLITTSAWLRIALSIARFRFP